MVPNRSLLRVIRNSVHRAIVLARYILNIVDYVIAKQHINSRFLKVECEFTFEFINL